MTATPLQAPAATHADSALAWRRALPLWIAVAAWIGLWYRDTARAMWDMWMFSDTYAHGVLVLPLALWLVWRRREHLATLAPRPAAWPLLLMAGAAAVWFLADLVVVNAAAQFAFVALLVLSVPAVLGAEVARALMFPLGFLFFGVPFGDFLLEPLMQGTADFTVAALRLSGVPVVREGLHFEIPSGSWSVVEACSGVRYLIASVMVGSLFAYLNYRSPRRRWIFVGVSILVPILANWLRAYMIVMLGHLSDNRIATGVDHIIYGWVFFGFVILVMFMIGMRWAEPEASEVSPQSGTRPAAGGAAASLAALAVMTAGAVMVAVAPHAAGSALAALERDDTPVLTAVAATGGWQPVLAPESVSLPAWKPLYQRPSAESAQVFGRDGSYVGLYLAYYRAQDAKRKLISQANILINSKDPDWALAGSGQRPVQAAGQRIDVRTAELRAGRVSGARQRIQIWRVYWVNGRWIEADVPAKLYGGLMRLAGRGDESAVMVLHTLHDGQRDPGEVLQEFLDANLPGIEQALVAARDGPGLSSLAATSGADGQ
ncbi:MAG: exosortase A [Burkholderiales bacterium]|nr:exosortase A [Burkholderiales bacterium]